jgi:hypothetical protein
VGGRTPLVRMTPVAESGKPAPDPGRRRFVWKAIGRLFLRYVRERLFPTDRFFQSGMLCRTRWLPKILFTTPIHSHRKANADGRNPLA